MVSLIWLVVVYPLAGALINTLFGKSFSKQTIGTIACGSVLLSFVTGLFAFASLSGFAQADQFQVISLYRWIGSGDTTINMSFLADPLSMVMVLVVSGVSFLIHLYSTGYMWHPAYTENEQQQQGEFRRFFVYMNLFVASMLLLVTASNYLLLLVGWEGVGLCSYLLISFEFRRRSAMVAGIKAFVVNAIGDVALLIGIVILYTLANSTEYGDVFPKAASLGTTPNTWITLLFLFAATAKSAQIPLYTWLPDAMEGPTPVSALIHAATMVTAGVYLMARSYPLLQFAPTTALIVAIIGVATAFFAATIGLVQPDLKRVLAYSTISQLGYMFIGIGVGGYGSSIFHLMTHAFFKAALFLCAGNVIHALINEHTGLGEQDMRNMGGLRAKLPSTYLAMVIAGLALAGMFPVSGFWSKDAILGAALQSNVLFYLIGLLTAGLTAFYTFRLIYLTFHGAYRGPKELYEHAHEAPSNMVVPIGILAVLAAIGGLVQIPGLWTLFDDYLGGTFNRYPAAQPIAVEQVGTFWTLALVAIIVVGIGILIAWRFYGTPAGEATPKRLATQFGGLYNVILNKWYVDEGYDAAVVRPTLGIAAFFATVVDHQIIDGVVMGVGSAIGTVGEGLRSLQTGFVRQYMLSMLVGVVVIVAFLLAR